ncbi:hypothetical protein VB711_12155 [Cronbergia sp. UHCC 0137]|uniref:hypothetical protein n=1 Tax=Cronbergia sp. UHCC 0137 TaxID=3110239 RepID=UPI002B21315A|nr:hypothetical protein [Cronbergia sp. UHCC 0137]MEA5618583.1 hypothetical protein [Cronbergia sp. UHCC 0137]
MNDNNTCNDHPLFDDLSEAEQESITAGQDNNIFASSDFFFQKTDIQSGADNNLNLGGSETNSQSSNYSLSQITIGSSITFRLPNFNLGRNKLKNLLSNIFR